MVFREVRLINKRLDNHGHKKDILNSSKEIIAGRTTGSLAKLKNIIETRKSKFITQITAVYDNQYSEEDIFKIMNAESDINKTLYILKYFNKAKISHDEQISNFQIISSELYPFLKATENFTWLTSKEIDAILRSWDFYKLTAVQLSEKIEYIHNTLGIKENFFAFLDINFSDFAIKRIVNFLLQEKIELPFLINQLVEKVKVFDFLKERYLSLKELNLPYSNNKLFRFVVNFADKDFDTLKQYLAIKTESPISLDTLSAFLHRDVPLQYIPKLQALKDQNFTLDEIYLIADFTSEVDDLEHYLSYIKQAKSDGVPLFTSEENTWVSNAPPEFGLNFKYYANEWSPTYWYQIEPDYNKFRQYYENKDNIDLPTGWNHAFYYQEVVNNNNSDFIEVWDNQYKEIFQRKSFDFKGLSTTRYDPSVALALHEYVKEDKDVLQSYLEYSTRIKFPPTLNGFKSIFSLFILSNNSVNETEETFQSFTNAQLGNMGGFHFKNINSNLLEHIAQKSSLSLKEKMTLYALANSSNESDLLLDFYNRINYNLEDLFFGENSLPVTYNQLDKVNEIIKSEYRNSFILLCKLFIERSAKPLIFNLPNDDSLYFILRGIQLGYEPSEAARLGRSLFATYKHNILPEQLDASDYAEMALRTKEVRNTLANEPFYKGNFLVVSNNEVWGKDLPNGRIDRPGKTGKKRFFPKEEEQLLTKSLKKSPYETSLEHMSVQNSEYETMIKFKEHLIEKIATTPPPLRFVFEGHGGPTGLYFFEGQINEDGKPPDKQLLAQYISDLDLANAILERSKNFPNKQNELAKDVYFFSSCFSFNYLDSVAKIVSQNSGILPIFMGTGEFGQYSFTQWGTSNTSQVLQFNNPQTTLGDIFNSEDQVFDSDFSVYVPGPNIIQPQKTIPYQIVKNKASQPENS